LKHAVGIASFFKGIPDSFIRRSSHDLFSFLLVLGMEPRDSDVLGKHTEPHPSSTSLGFTVFKSGYFFFIPSWYQCFVLWSSCIQLVKQKYRISKAHMEISHWHKHFTFSNVCTNESSNTTTMVALKVRDVKSTHGVFGSCFSSYLEK
jgi:hypothetical protein